jgi:hypothetical protein
MGYNIRREPKGLMEDTKCGMDMEGAPLGGKREGEVFGMILRHNIMVRMESIDTNKVYVYKLLCSFF